MLAQSKLLQRVGRAAVLTVCWCRKRSNKLDWMYASPNANLNGSAENNMEEFLLGKKNVDELLRAKQRQEIVSWHGCITERAHY